VVLTLARGLGGELPIFCNSYLVVRLDRLGSFGFSRFSLVLVIRYINDGLLNLSLSMTKLDIT